MTRSRAFWGVVILALLVTLSVAAHSGPGQLLVGVTGRLVAPVFVRLHLDLGLIGAFTARYDLAAENVRLRDALTEAQSGAARVTDLAEENAFLRGSASIHERVSGPLVEASVFSDIRSGGIREMSINRGSDDGIALGDVVATVHGALVGRIIQLFPWHAVVRTVGDPALEVTGKILNSDVSGLVRLDASRGLLLDLVQKDEVVTEEQIVVTSGNDQFPAGFVIGTVSSVDSDSATLFKTVHITPAIERQFGGRVLVFHP